MGNLDEKYTRLKLEKVENIRYCYTVNKANFLNYSINMTILVLGIFLLFNIINILQKVV